MLLRIQIIYKNNICIVNTKSFLIKIKKYIDFVDIIFYFIINKF